MHYLSAIYSQKRHLYRVLTSKSVQKERNPLIRIGISGLLTLKRAIVDLSDADFLRANSFVRADADRIDTLGHGRKIDRSANCIGH